MDSFDVIMERLKKAMNVTQDKELAEKLGLTKGNFSRYKQSDRLPLKEILDYCVKEGITINPILSGEAHPLLKIISKDEVKNILPHEIAIPYHTNVSASCGSGCFGQSHLKIKYIVLDRSSHFKLSSNVEAINAFGDSMIPLIKEDSIVFVDRFQTDIKDFATYLFVYENQLYIKVLAPEINTPNVYKAISVNQIYPVMSITNLDQFQVLGKVVYST